MKKRNFSLPEDKPEPQPKQDLTEFITGKDTEGPVELDLSWLSL